MKRKPLPPNGAKFQRARGHAWVAIGAGAWDLAQRKSFPVMVIAPGVDPLAFTWPVAGRVVTVVETGSFDTEHLERLALALLRAGARRVIAAREALFREKNICPLAFFVRERHERIAA